MECRVVFQYNFPPFIPSNWGKRRKSSELRIHGTDVSSVRRISYRHFLEQIAVGERCKHNNHAIKGKGILRAEQIGDGPYSWRKRDLM
ncbi:hypothetical protein VNO77_25380 [Canavalia gladiata]|uniref:Uncharacterized protein n=1 Tax=Canavalia gladiata TaxID=3824 RepID=A0AAN9LD64_CANGL